MAEPTAPRGDGTTPSRGEQPTTLGDDTATGARDGMRKPPGNGALPPSRDTTNAAQQDEKAARQDEKAARRHEVAKLSRGFSWLAVLGVILVVAGLVGLVYTGVATLTSMILFGWLLLIGGVIGLLHAVQARGSNFFWLGVVVAALNIAAGVVVLKTPDAAAEALTMFAALLFLTGGLFRLVGSLVVRGPQFGWTLVQGAFGLLLGVLVLASWPSSSQYVIGTFFSLALLFDGLGLIATGYGGRRIVGMVSDRLAGEEPAKPVQPE